MFLPLLVILLALISAGAVAYGAHPYWAQYPHGLEVIVWSRRLQWPLVAVALIGCLLLLGLVVSGKRRLWWLVALAPVLALFAHRFAIGPAAGSMTVVEAPAFVPADQASFVGRDDWVVGLSFGSATYAYPYATLYATPIVIQADHEKRMMLMWSAFANRALAVGVNRQLKGRDLEVVSTPANALLLFDRRTGQFINALTGQTLKHEKPLGMGAPIPLVKMTWGAWRALHPETLVMAASRAATSPAPTRPILPAWPMPPMSLDRPANTLVTVIGSTAPVAIESGQIRRSPLNLTADGEPVLLFRDDPDSPPRAFRRRIKPDLVPRFDLNRNLRKHPKAVFIDADTGSGWDANGVWVDGLKELKGKRLERVPVEDGLYWGVMKYWYPQLVLSDAPKP